jgi:hypothetical protein
MPKAKTNSPENTFDMIAVFVFVDCKSCNPIKIPNNGDNYTVTGMGGRLRP